MAHDLAPPTLMTNILSIMPVQLLKKQKSFDYAGCLSLASQQALSLFFVSSPLTPSARARTHTHTHKHTHTHSLSLSLSLSHSHMADYDDRRVSGEEIDREVWPDDSYYPYPESRDQGLEQVVCVSDCKSMRVCVGVCVCRLCVNGG